jgi:hypothetical protein
VESFGPRRATADRLSTLATAILFRVLGAYKQHPGGHRSDAAR